MKENKERKKEGEGKEKKRKTHAFHLPNSLKRWTRKEYIFGGFCMTGR